MYSTLAYSLWNYFTCFFDYIPKIMYFLYAAVASCLDAMQLLMRRLAGLDVYYVNRDTGGLVTSGTGTATTGDPVMEFIYGILGIGENAGSYQALNTTFWSLAIFAVIVLVVSTMIALIKSHYQEDGAKTAPLQYIYTAIKAILTFCIVPFAVIIGLMTSNFLLSTLDSITAGSGTEEALIGIYGSDALSQLKAHETEDGDKYYSRYDFFGFGAASNSTTFSGALFKATAYEANRIRIGEVGQDSGDGGVTGFYDFDGFFGSGSSGYTAATDKREYIAYQIDYAFQNNFDLKDVVAAHAMKIYSDQKDGSGSEFFLTISGIDVFGLAGFVTNFSKYNVGLVWAYYNLWKFNFMVGIASIIVCFGIFISIIIGLMSRLIKSIILFLIYAPTLGLAPMDEFGAFKKWRTEFMQQILMAFGSVIGMNIFFLVLPYINNIAFFNIYLIDAIVSIVVMVTGLMIIKSLVSFFSGLVGGADALKEGDDLKGDLGKTLATSAKVAVGVGSAVTRFGNPLGLAVVRRLQGFHYEDKYKGLKDEMTNEKAEGDRIMAGLSISEDDANRKYGEALMSNQREEEKLAKKLKAGTASATASKAFNEAYGKALKENGGDEDAAYETALKAAARTNSAYAANEGIIERKGYDVADYAKYKDAQDHFEKVKNLSERAEKVRQVGYLNEKGETDRTSLAQSMANTFRNAGGTLAKALMEGMLPALKIDPGKILDITRAGSNKKYDKDGKLVGQYWGTKVYDNGTLQPDGTIKPSNARTMKQRRLNRTKADIGPLALLGGNAAVAKAESKEDKALETAKNTESEAKKQTKILRELLKRSR